MPRQVYPVASMAAFRLTSSTASSVRKEASPLLRAAETFLGGGTNFERPLTEALTLMEDHGFENADIVFLTDGECCLPETFAEDFRRKQTEKNFTVTGILLDVGCPGMEFSLTPFCRKIYRTSQLCGEDIVRSVISELAA